jgi:predicted RNase H-like nuclease
VFAESSFQMANRRARELLGRGISQQAWALRKSVEEVGCLARDDRRIIEVHPEVSFRALIGAPLQWSKTSWNGQALRGRALASRAIELPEMLDEAAGVPPADVLDAAVAAWSARRHASEESRSLPTSAAHGERQVIWY